MDPRELQLFLKKLRVSIPERIRYYGVGEYGDYSGRPHYHLAIFGMPDPRHNGWRTSLPSDPACECVVCKSWGKGLVDIGLVTRESAAYICGYTTKRATCVGDSRLDGRHPEFARMSLRPGIGCAAMPVVSEAVKKSGYVAKTGDVPAVLRHESKMWPLGRYLRGKLRENLGLHRALPTAISDVLSVEMQQSLRPTGARQQRESKREQVSRRAHALNSITKSKKGVGV